MNSVKRNHHVRVADFALRKTNGKNNAYKLQHFVLFVFPQETNFLFITNFFSTNLSFETMSTIVQCAPEMVNAEHKDAVDSKWLCIRKSFRQWDSRCCARQDAQRNRRRTRGWLALLAVTLTLFAKIYNLLNDFTFLVR